jgi:hypothetical protein
MVINSPIISTSEKIINPAKHNEISVKLDKFDEYLEIRIIASSENSKPVVVWHKKIFLIKSDNKLSVQIKINISQECLQSGATIV